MSALLESVPGEWEFSTLGDLNSRKAPTVNPKDFSDETFEYYSIPDYQRDQRPSLTKGGAIESSKLLLEPKTVLFGKLNPRVEKVWRVAQSREFRQIGSTEWIPILPTARIDADFLYFLEWSDHVMPIAKTLVSGSTPSRQRVDPTSFYRLRVPLPPLPEQKKIAHILSTVQRAIEAQERIIQTTTELKKALMNKLFTEGLRHEPQKQTEIGPIPQSWKVVKIKDHCIDSAFGPRFGSELYAADGNIVTLRTTDMEDDGRIDYNTAPLARIDYSKFKKHYLQVGDVVVSRSGTCGIASVFEGNPLPVLPGAFLIRLRMKNSVQPKFLQHYINSPVGRPYVLQLAQGAIQKNISGTRLGDLLVPLPSRAEQEEVSSAVGTIDRKLANHRQKLAANRDLFRTLLHELMTAKMRVHRFQLDVKGA